ncbi:hypothetical protein SK571_03690 [Lentzea sp. BCCO 10_0798]|uniref:Uncharacterized protein n=1 Tax=Lentzea kristufekii TaxID=3095430 RepID=A0ABU4TJQ2_9PSEU|nr:hypothetical protein [Lentzea sp. BCCO 10_0798]MDX8048473.1 hypothetical protein [Lentzea sp. BCCO 10_0798]
MGQPANSDRASARLGAAGFATRSSASFAALTTVGVAVGMDVAAGEHLLHTATIGAIAVVLAVLRVRLGGKYEGSFALLSGAIVVQPALHAMTKLVPGDTGHAAETSMSLLPVLLTAVVVAVVVGAQRLFSLFARRPLSALLRLLISVPVPSGVFAPHVWPDCAAIIPARHFTTTASRRGPPFSPTAAA